MLFCSENCPLHFCWVAVIVYIQSVFCEITLNFGRQVFLPGLRSFNLRIHMLSGFCEKFFDAAINFRTIPYKI